MSKLTPGLWVGGQKALSPMILTQTFYFIIKNCHMFQKIVREVFSKEEALHDVLMCAREHNPYQEHRPSLDRHDFANGFTTYLQVSISLQTTSRNITQTETETDRLGRTEKNKHRSEQRQTYILKTLTAAKTGSWIESSFSSIHLKHL